MHAPEDREGLGRRPGGAARKVLAIASSGGHWTELVRLKAAFRGHAVTWVTTNEGYRDSAPPGRFYVIRDANRWDKKGLVVMLTQIARILWKVRPDVVISTGAAPGYFALRLGRTLGARTAWVDSVANAEELSLSGLKVGPYADLWLTQWEHLATRDGPDFRGRVL